MHFDDRLDTVLRFCGLGDTGARTQYRQLVDLLGAPSRQPDGPLIDAAYDRLHDLVRIVPGIEQSRILREPGQRLRNPRIVAWLAQGEAQAAAAAMATAKLDEDQWLSLIPRLPVNARGYLRHRRDLPPRAADLLAKLGVGDLVLSKPDSITAEPAPLPAPSPAPQESSAAEPQTDEGIRALVRRIEAFREARRSLSGLSDPKLPLGDESRTSEQDSRNGPIDLALDPSGRVTWAEDEFAPMLIGMSFVSAGPEALVEAEEAIRLQFRRRQPIRGATVKIVGAEPVAGTWRLDAYPQFMPSTGSFTGYLGRLRRPAVPPVESADAESPFDRVRQVLHELRTPVNAIQGYAEIIQQQLFGPAPNSYRALAAAIAVDGARLLAGFDDIDRLCRLEAGAMNLEAGETDFRSILVRTAKRLEGALGPRNARLELEVSGGPFAVGLAEDEVAQLAWRLLASLAGAMAPGEIIKLALTGDGRHVRLATELPESLAKSDDIFTSSLPRKTQALSAGMFGSGFTLRLARAEAGAAGGSLETGDDRLVLKLPALTAPSSSHSHGPAGDRQESAA